METLFKFGTRMRVIRRNRRQAAALRKWDQEGRQTPPPHLFKQSIIREYAQRSNAVSLVETGTFRGDMVEAMRSDFKNIYSIELSEKYFEKAVRRFSGDQRIRLFQGDSATQLGSVVSQLNGPAVFWLDGHYSAGDTARGLNDTPVFQEFAQILARAEHLLGHVILVDDARCFGTDPGYPSTDELQAYFKNRGVDCHFEIADDIIRITHLKARQQSVAA
jgi:hypothetical protein